MQDFLPFIVIGITTGSIYGLAGMGLVLTYKTSGIFFFGYGAVAALSVFLFYFLQSEHGVPWPLAAAICLLLFAPALGVALELLARSLHAESETIKVVATVGLILIVAALGDLWHPDNFPTFPHFFPQSTVQILKVNVTWEQIIVFAFSATAAAVLYWFFQSARLGILMRGVVDNAELVSMTGDDPTRVRRWAWVIGSVFASVAGLMLAPSQPVDGVALTIAVFAAFGAAAIGSFSNLPLTFIGGLVIGIASALVDKYSATVSWIGGLAPSLPALVLFGVLMVIPRNRLARRQSAQVRVRDTYYAPLRVRLIAGVVVIVVLAFIPFIQQTRLILWSAALIDVILFLSLGILVRRSGQISLCQLAFAAVGAAAYGHFMADHVPWLLAVVLATLIAVPVGAVISIPAIRVSGVFLALATLGLGILAEQALYDRAFLFGSSPLGLAEPRPDVAIGGLNLSTDEGFYYLVLVVVIVVVAAVTAIARGRLGRLLEAMADSPLALETHGTASTVLKVIVFCIAASMASLAGALTGMLYHYALGSYFQSFNSLTLVALVVIIAIGEPWYAIVGAIAYAVIPGYITGATTNNVLTLLFGMSAITAAYGTKGGSAPAAVRRMLDRIGRRAEALPFTAAPAAGQPARQAADRPENQRRAGLVVTDLSVHFGGVTAVSDLTIEAPMNRITGLVGPNGAGKTSTFNVCSGLNRAASGKVVLHGIDVSREGPAARARRGLGRTFQRSELFSSLTVRQNVALGREAFMAGGNPMAQIFGTRHGNAVISAAVNDSLALTSIGRLAEVRAGLLPVGQRRIVELARTLAGPFDLLLMDEPSSGLDGYETQQLGSLLRRVVSERGCGILLVEHDMTLVRNVCDYVYVLDFGTLIFQGTPDEMQRSDRVRAAYLGEVSPVAETASHGSDCSPLGEPQVVEE